MTTFVLNLDDTLIHIMADPLYLILLCDNYTINCLVLYICISLFATNIESSILGCI